MMYCKWLGVFLLIPFFLIGRDKDIKEPKILPALRTKVLTKTFLPYENRQNIINNITQWKSRSLLNKHAYKVSLVGVNINAWLENPQYFYDLQDEGTRFKIENLLDNLQANNPQFIFNDPSLVERVLNSDIYSPYLEILAVPPKKNLHFSDITHVVTFAKKYNIYGVGAAGLPYFGRPIQGSKDEINLGVFRGQLCEISTKFPETDIFLVAMINIIPNWLEENSNVMHISQQRLEILIYAFDRYGHMIGGAGIPSSFYYNGQYFLIEQAINSKVWQPGISRKFYLLPSRLILNDYRAQDDKEARIIEFSPEKIPVLSKIQKYILSCIKQRRAEGLSIDVQFFSSEGTKLLENKKIPTQSKIHLEDKILVHKNLSLLVRKDNKEEIKVWDFLSHPLYVRLDDKNSNGKDRSLTKKMQPSNEGAKLISLLNYGQEMLVQSVITHKNKKSYTNEILPFEEEMDPILYQKRRNEYYRLINGYKKIKADFQRETKGKIRKEKNLYADRIFWYKFLKSRLIEQNFKVEDVINSIDELCLLYHEIKKVVKINIKLDREKELHDVLKRDIEVLKSRNEKDIESIYADKPEVRARKLETLGKKYDAMMDRILEQLSDPFMDEKMKEMREYHQELLEKEQIFIKKIKTEIPENINYLREIRNHHMFILDISEELIRNEKDIAYFSELHDMQSDLIAVAFVKRNYSPEYRYILSGRNKEKMAEWKNTRRLSFEGFILGLTKSWHTKTELEDRMDYL